MKERNKRLGTTKLRCNNLLFDFHIGVSTLNSIMNITYRKEARLVKEFAKVKRYLTAAMMTAPNAAFGIKVKYGVKNNRAKMTNTPV